MDEENKDSILAEVVTEGAMPDETTTETDETPSESPTENTPEEAKPDQGATEDDVTPNTDPEDKRPFHEHPRWIEREQKLKELEDFKSQADRELEELRQFKDKFNPSQPDVPSWFADLYGNDPDAYNKYLTSQTELKEQVKREIIEEQQKAQAAEEAENAHWSQWVETEMSKIDGLKAENRNDFLSFMLKYKPTTDDNLFDFQAGYELYQIAQAQKGEATKAKTDAKKKIAALTSDKPKGDDTKKDYVTNIDLRNKGWTSL